MVVGGLLHHGVRDEGAEVVLEVVESPGGVCVGILLLVAEGGGVAGAGFVAGTGVEADFEALGVDVVGEGLHVREFGVGGDVALSVAGAFPGVVNVDVDVAGIFHAGGDDLVSGGADTLVVDALCEVVPGVPTHGGGLCDGRHFLGEEGTGGEEGGGGEEERIAERRAHIWKPRGWSKCFRFAGTRKPSGNGCGDPAVNQEAEGR